MVISSKWILEQIITNDSTLLSRIEKGLEAAKTELPLIVYGESGVGKELFAKGIHRASGRNGNYIPQKCAAVSALELERKLFGFEKKEPEPIYSPGLLEMADGGTIFLDDLQALPLDLQKKLLSIMDEGLVRRVGGTDGIEVNVRIIATMNIDPKTAEKEKKLASDLYERMKNQSYEIPPLRKRQGDISLLAGHFLETFNKANPLYKKEIAADVEEVFMQYRWPGNVRELKHTIEYMMLISKEETLTKKTLPFLMTAQTVLLPLRQALQETEKTMIERALKMTNGNVFQASKLLEIPRQTLQYKLQKLKNLIDIN